MDEEIDDYEKHNDFLEKFITKGDQVAFRKMLNLNLTSNARKEEKEREKALQKQHFFNSMKNHHSHFHHHEHGDIFSKGGIYNPFPNNELNNYKLDFHNFFQDPEYKNKCMKGNYRWANMRFQMIKNNLAKRKGINVNEFQMPKVPIRKKNNMEMNGKIIMGNNNVEIIGGGSGTTRAKSYEGGLRNFKSYTMPRKNKIMQGNGIGTSFGGGEVSKLNGISNLGMSLKGIDRQVVMKRQNTQQVPQIICELNDQ